jgi:hypothetical protein
VQLDEKLASLASTMSDEERANYKLLLGMAAGGLAQEGRPPEGGVEAVAFATAVSSLTMLQPHRQRIPRNGVAYRGRPEFVSDELFSDLERESARLRPTAIRFDDHLVVSGAPLARAVAFSRELNDLITAHTGPVAPTAKANYLYYDQAGFGIDPHIDNETFSLNAILMLEHTYETKPSALVLYPPRSSPEKIHLEPGELIVMYADSITHARERMGENEVVRIVAFGFHPITK